MSERIERASKGGRFELKVAADGAAGEGLFTGHAALFGVPHPTSAWSLPSDWQDVFVAGAFGKSLAEHKSNGTRPAMLLMHERGQIVGSWKQLSEDKSGLMVEGQLTVGKQLGRDVYADMKNEALSELSVGFRPVKAELDEKKKIRTLIEVDLGEISVVDIGGCRGSRVEDVKALSDKQHTQTAAQIGALQSCCDECDGCDGRDEMLAGLKSCLDTMGEGKSLARMDITKRYLERVLRDAGLRPEEAKALLSRGYGALDGVRDAAVEAMAKAIDGRTQLWK